MTIVSARASSTHARVIVRRAVRRVFRGIRSQPAIRSRLALAGASARLACLTRQLPSSTMTELFLQVSVFVRLPLSMPATCL